MPIQIKAPDGSIAQFPDGTPDSAITAAMAKAYPQPLTLDKIVASPVGRFTHDAVIEPIMGIGSLLSKIDPTAPAPEKVVPMMEQPYQGALARNRNTPGYANARQQANAMLGAKGGSGLSDQIIAPFAPTAAGVAGLFGGGLDQSNAAADAQSQAQAQYAAAHPIISTAAQLAGGALAGPESVAARLPRAPTDFGFEASLLGNHGAPPVTPPLTPQDAALAHVSSILKSSGKSATDLAGLNTSKPLTAAEATGNAAEVDLGALARREGATPDALAGLVKARSASAPARILSDYAAASGINPLAARGDIESFVEANQKAATPLYEQAYKANTNVASPLLDKILDTPAGKKALSDARVKMQNDMTLMGTPDADLMDQAKEGGTALPARGVASGMKLRVYDYVKKSLDDQISAAFKIGNKHEAGIIKDLKNKLVGALDDADITAIAGPNSLKPDGGAYAQARAKAGEYLSAKKQYEAGQDQIFDHNLPALDFKRYYEKLGEADKQAFLGGAANKLFNVQQAGRLKADIFKAPVIQQKLATVMGPEKASDFLRNMQTEQAMAEFARKRAPGAGSPTAELQQAMSNQDNVSSLAMDAGDFVKDAVQRGPVRATIGLAGRKLGDAYAAYVTRGMSVPVRDEAGRLWMLPPKDLAAALSKQTLAPSLPLAAVSKQIPIGLIGSGAYATGHQ